MSAVELQSQISELQLAIAEQAEQTQKLKLAHAEQAEQAQKLKLAHAEQAQKLKLALAEQAQKSELALAEQAEKSELALAELAEQKEKLDEVLKLNAQSRVRDARSRIGELPILSFFLQSLSILLNFRMSHVRCSFFVV